VKEAICSETPVVYMPFFAEQVRSAMVAKQLGFAEYLNKMTVNAEEVVTQMTKVLQNDNYHKQIQKRKSLFLDRVIDPLEEGAFWAEKTIKYNGRPVMFKRTGIMLYWLQFVYFDSFFVLLIALLFFGSK
jgi:glucuronosyltransferase